MESLSGFWLSLKDSIFNFPDWLEFRINILTKTRLGRFMLGTILGIFPVAIYWGYAIFFHVDIPLDQGIIGGLVFMFVLGILGIYGKLDRLLDSLSSLPL